MPEQNKCPECGAPRKKVWRIFWAPPGYEKAGTGYECGTVTWPDNPREVSPGCYQRQLVVKQAVIEGMRKGLAFYANADPEHWPQIAREDMGSTARKALLVDDKGVTIRKATTPEAREIWAGVEKVAESCPDWMRPTVLAAAQKSARRILADDKGGE